VVIIPNEIAPNAKVDQSNLEAVMKSLNMNESNVQKLQMN
jgi:hypothetical protein